MTDLTITPARRRALAVLALKGEARSSTATDHAAGTVANATLRILHQHGLIVEDTARVTGRRVGGIWTLTPAGRALAADHGLNPQEAS